MHLRLHNIFKRRKFFPHLEQNWQFEPRAARLEELYQTLKTSEQGLTESEARHRLSLYGLNEPAKKEKRKLLYEIILGFANPLIILLLIIGTFSVFFGEKFSAIIIYVMAAMSAMLSFIQEHRAEKAVEKLNALVRVTANVKRDEQIKEKNTKELVPGDIVSLSAGNVIPADLRIIAARDLFINQASLTGESIPVEKFAENHPHPSLPPNGGGVGEGVAIFQAENLAFMGSSVVSGTGLGLVIHTGRFTEFGKLAQSLAENKTGTAFDKGIKDFTWLMIKAILLMVVVIVVINFIGKHNFFESLLFALAVAVGLAPETLPMIVTINLSKGALDMSKKKVVVKRLDAIQNFGAMDVLCTDKTGTLTLDEVVLEKHCDVLGKENVEVLEYGFLNSFYQTGLKNLLDMAVLKHKHPHLEGFEKIDEIPFDFNRKIMSVAVAKEGRHLLISKGAPEEIFKRCTFLQDSNQTKKLQASDLNNIQQIYQTLSGEGFRVLAVAYKELPEQQKIYSANDESGLILKGFMAFLDPPKPTAKQTVKELEKVGIKIKILTGDNELVTKKICGDIGLDVEGLLTGEMIEKFKESELSKVVETTTVFARMLPLQKEKIIKILRANGHTVGFLGDGINDAPALKCADVGISVNNAAEVARESASIILLKKSLTVLNDGVLEGRRVFGNIIKYLRMGSSSNFGNMLSMTGASLILPFLPMAPVQILLNNFLYDVSQIGIPTDKVDSDYLQKPRSWNINLIKKFMVTLGPVSSLFDFATFAVMWWVFQGFNNVSLFRTGWFLESLFTQTLVIYVIRSRKIPFLQSRPSRFLVFTSLIILAVALAIPYTALGKFFDFVRPPVLYFAILAAIVFVYLVLVQIVKNWFVKRYES